MIDVAFISDLHLHPKEPDIQSRFDCFLDWAKASVKKVYILGDFFHAWVGDDGMDDWSRGVAAQLLDLKNHGIEVFYMHGNRDFLLGKQFSALAGWTILAEPTLIQLGDEPILLVHGDRYCTKDSGHQLFRLITRNPLFTTLFQYLFLSYRQKLVHRVRERSMSNTNKTSEQMDVVAESVIKHMMRYHIDTLIHGHTHKPGVTEYEYKGHKLRRYVLSDWDDSPQILCYDKTKGLHFVHF